MLKITEVRRWAKDKGYIITKHAGSEEEANYSWYKVSDPSIKGEARSVSKVATAVFNNLTDNQWVDYQEQYRKDHV
jgi:hypothetical protein